VEQPPSSTDKELAAYLVRQLTALQSKLDSGIIVPKYTALPDRPIIGKLYYFSNTIGATITSIGVWVYKSTGWTFVA
jgi:hypothetical protein